MTATLFGLDAWFDVLTAAAGSAWYESLADAFFAEIPMAILLTAFDRSSTIGGHPRHRERPPATDPGEHLLLTRLELLSPDPLDVLAADIGPLRESHRSPDPLPQPAL